MRLLPPILAILVLAAVSSAATAQAIPRPVVGTVVRGTCPGEGCRMGEWTALRRTPAFDRDSPGAGVAFQLDQCERVTAVEGVTHITRVGLYRAVRAYTVYRGNFEGEGPIVVPPGDSLIVMTYAGEGYFRFWWRGMQVLGDIKERTLVEELQEGDDDWWVLARKQDGRVGWLNMEESEMRSPGDDEVPGCTIPASAETRRIPAMHLQRVSPSTCSAAPAEIVRLDAHGQDTFVGNVYHQAGAPISATISFGGWGDYYFAYLQFALPPRSSRPPGGKAILCLFATITARNDPGLLVGVVSDVWIGRSLTLATLPRHELVAEFGPVVRGWNALDVTPLFDGWTTGEIPNHGLVLVPQNNNEANGAFASSEAPDPATRPRLVLQR
jgi:hypothetical protein